MRQGTLVFRFVLLLGCLALAGQAALEAANWPRFRGPNGAGTADDKNIPVQFTDKDFLWKTTLPGEGHSSPVIWGDKLFIQSADASKRMILCVDVKDGKILWNQSEPGSTSKKHSKNSLASSTPATDGERVYCYFWDGKAVSVSAYDMSGTRLWNHPIGGFTSQHGAGASPVVYDGKVFVNNDQDGKADLIALDAKTGKPAWQVPRKPFRACYSPPFIHNNGLVVASTAGITSYNPSTGAVNWNWDWKFDGMALRTIGCPVAGNGLIFVSSGDGGGSRHMVAVKDGGKGLAWENKDKSAAYVPAMLLSGEHLFWVNDGGIVGCTDAKSGKEIWNQRLPGGSQVSSSPVLINGAIYVGREDGTVVVYAAGTAWKQLGTSKLPERIMSSPAVADGRLFIRGESGTLYCIGKK